MKKRFWSWMGLCLLLLAGAWFFWPAAQPRGHSQKPAAPPAPQAAVTTRRAAATAPLLFAAGNAATNSAPKTNAFAYRLTNSKKSLAQLMSDPHAILLENALLETGGPLALSIPKNLQAQGDPGAYIVQASGPINNAFRATLAAAGAQIVSYIPNDAYLVTVSGDGAATLAGQPGVQSVIPYEPYYKISESLLGLAVNQKNLPDNSVLTLGLFPNTATATIDQIKSLGATVVATDQSPFGPVVRVTPPQNWTALAVLPGVQIMELAHRRALANDLARVTLGISADTVTPTNYMGLSGSNVLVEVNDTGIDAAHLDFSVTGSAETPGIVPPSRVIADSPLSIVDTNGHGTHVAGIIAGNGSKSYFVTNTPQGSVTNADFRGKAPAAYLYSVAALDDTGTSDTSDYYLQTAPALTNALISNNSWTYVGDSSYDLAAASYDAAVRDALPTVTGSQPVLFVFAAGNDGGGGDDGQSGNPDTIDSPGTAKDVITVGALQQDRGITNSYTPLGTTNQVQAWFNGTSSSYLVAGYSSLGNVGIGTEGAFGRFKPDVVAPGSFVVSTRSSEWDQNAYYNPTNDNLTLIPDFVDPLSMSQPSDASFTVYPNAAVVTIQLEPVATATTPLTNNLSIYVWPGTDPFSATPIIFANTNFVSLPAVPNNTSWSCAVSNPNNSTVSYNMVVDVLTTNDMGNYYTVLSNLNDSIGPWYRYESGTSMSAPAISGVLALMQDYFTNTLRATPSPALLKAMLINGSRSLSPYYFTVTNNINFQGWGLANIQNSVPPGLTNQLGVACSELFLDQSPTNALATGDSQSYLVTVTNTAAQAKPLRVTLAWTDPPGNPAAAIKLVNNLILMVSNNVTGDVYFGNDIPQFSTVNETWNTNTAPNLDTINNVENVFLPSSDAGSYTVTVLGYSVNVNAVTAQTNNTVQDYALVIACGEGEVTNAITVTASAPVSNPTGDQDTTVVGIDANGMATNSEATGGVFLNQLAGANTPLLGTNTVDALTNYSSTAVVTVGMTNQWHFYVVQNTTTFTNAAFVTFLPDTLSMPRMGVLVDPNANPSQNPTTPEADIDMYVSTDPSLTNLNPVVISNCVNGTQVGMSVPGTPPIFNGASLSGGGTEYVADTGSQPNEVYYVGVKSETAVASEYGFLPVFSQLPFSETVNGVEYVNGLLLPMPIPDGSNKNPGTAYIFALAIQPIQVEDVIVNDTIVHQNFGDLIGTLSHNGMGAVLNNHEVLGNPPGPYDFIYDDSPSPVAGSQPPDGPGNLNEFQGQQGTGPWILTEVDDAPGNTGYVTNNPNFTITITPNKPLTAGVYTLIPGGGYYYGFIDVPVGVTNLTLAATNVSGTVTPGGDFTAIPLDTGNPGQLFEKLGQQPAPPPTPPTNYDKMVILDNPATPPPPPGGIITVGPSDNPPIEPGRYFVTLYNASPNPQEYFIIATLGVGQVQPVDFTPVGPVPLLDDAVSYAYITNFPGVGATNETIASIAVGLRVEHPRISDLVFTLISPDGTRYLLMQNRGGTSTNGAGATIYSTNDIANYTASGTTNSITNFVAVSTASGTLPISWNFYTIDDQMTVYDNTNGNYGMANIIFNTGMTNGTGQVNLPFTTTSGLAIIINQFGNTNGVNGDAWTYTAGGVQTNFAYLTFTDDTNITTPPIPSPMIPIKFAPTPFVPGMIANIMTNIMIVQTVVTNFSTNIISSLAIAAGDYPAGFAVDGWTVLTNQISVVADPLTGLNGSNLLALATGAISNALPTMPGQIYTLSFAYRGPGIVGMWRGEGNGNDSIAGNNGTVQNITYINGMVGQAFSCNPGPVPLVQIPDQPAFVLTNALSIEGWIRPRGGNIIFWRGDNRAGADPYVLQMQGSSSVGFDIEDTANTASTLAAIVLNQWSHVVGTYDRNSGTMRLYVNGALANQTTTPIIPVGNLIPADHPGIGIGDDNDGAVNFPFDGDIDEMSLYSRALSASEIKATYNLGTNGDFDSNFGFSTNLAEAQFTINGQAPTTIFGNNTNWQTQAIGFTATQTNAPLIIQGIEPGMLLDAFALTETLLTTNYSTNVFYTTNITVTANNLYYQPEQDLTPLVGTSAYGVWTLEIQDDRVGATNNAVLDSWELQFVFADTNPAPAVVTPPVLVPGSESCSLVPTNDIVWYQVNVPLNAISATNTLVSSDQPVNLWYSTNQPPSITTSTDFEMLTSATSGIYVLNTNSAPPTLVPGSTYYLGVQNPSSSSSVTDACVEVDFNLLGLAYAYTEPAQLVTGTNAQLNGFATPNGFQANAWFEWGTNTSYGNQTLPTPVGLGYNVVYTTSPILNLLTNVPYHFRLVVSNALGVVYGFDQILDEANVVAWGPNYAGQLDVPTNQNVTAIAGAYDHSLALTTNGQILAWGDNIFGQATVPAYLTNLQSLAVAGGQYYSMALLNGGTVFSWGVDLLPGQTNVPMGLNGVVTIAGGTYSSLALQNNGTVVAWGAGFYGLTNVPVNATNTVAISAGGYHSLALKNDGTVTAWGDYTNVPPGLNNVVAIAAGGYHSLALKSDGTVVAWGDDSVGQTNVPAGLSNVVAIAAGGFHNLALRSDGTLVTWGDNSAGQSSVPVGLTNVVAISAGYLHSLALTPQILINSTNPFILPLLPGVPQTNNIFAGDVTYYQVTVPTNADFATNTLLFANYGGLNIWFSTNTPPMPNATNATLLAGNVTNGVWVLNTNGVPLPPLVPGSTYYLGVQNPNNFTVNYAVQVDFHLTTPVIPPPFTNVITISSITYTNGGFLLTWFAPSNDLFQVQWSDGFPPSWQTFTNIVSYNTNYPASATNAEFTFFDDGSQAPFIGPTRFYRLIQLGSLTSLSNGVPQTADVAPDSTAYFTITVPQTTDAATNALLSATAPVNLLFNQTILPTGPNTGGYTLLTNSIGGISIVNAGSTPSLVPGATYYLGVQNTNSFTVQFTLQVDFQLPAAAITNYPISGVVFTNNGILFTWFAPTNYQFQIQWTTSLSPLPVSWTTVPGVVPTLVSVTGTTGAYQWFDDFTLTGGFGLQKFYRIIAYPPGVPVPSSLVISSAQMLPGGNLQLQWAGSTNYAYDVLWTTNLALAKSSWNVLSNLIPPTLVYSSGMFTFSANAVALTGGAPGVFFQVLELP